MATFSVVSGYLMSQQTNSTGAEITRPCLTCKHVTMIKRNVIGRLSVLLRALRRTNYLFI